MKNCSNDPEKRKALNRLAREQMKLKLMQDIMFDINVCRMDGFDYKEYLCELKEIIDGFIREVSE